MRAVDTLRRAAPALSVGILTADLMSLGAELAQLDATDVRVLHVDVMDGRFTPMMTVGPPFVKALRTPLLKDVHLMICEPLEQLAEFVAAGADIITVHAESCTHLHRALQQLGQMTNANDPERGLVRGLALNPGTPLEVLEPLLDQVDLLLLLAVNPSWKGQSFIPATYPRIARAQEMIARAGRNLLLCVDGGVNRDNIDRLAEAGVDLVVAGSAVYDGKAPADNARFLIQRLRSSSRRER